MSAGNDIFGNLDDFLANYDDHYLETSKLSDGEHCLDNSAREDDQPLRNKNQSKIVGTNQTAATKDITVKHPNQTAVAPKIAESIPSSSVVLPTPQSQPNTIDLTNDISLGDEMQELFRVFQYIFFHMDPMVTMHLKNESLYNLTKRSFNKLNESFLRKAPTTNSEIERFRKRMETTSMKLAELRSLADNFMSVKSNTSKRSTSGARRRSRRLMKTVVEPANVITLDSDDESAPVELENRSANNSFESENYEMRLKVKWGNIIEIFVHRKHQKFGDLIEKLAAKEKADTSCILLNLDDRIIYAQDTPDSIGYKTFQFISGRVLKEKAPIAQKAATAGNNNTIPVKVQLANRKTPLQFHIDKKQTMIVLVIKCAEELKCNPEDIKLYFDGDLVDNGSKPDDLELEGDELMDIRFVR